MDTGSFGTFAQRLSDVGLVFNITFAEDELQQQPSWSLFNRKIMAGVSSLPARIELPPRPPNMTGSVNSILWTPITRFKRGVRGQPGRHTFHLVPPPTIPTSDWTPGLIVDKFAVPNPISGPDDAPVPKHLIIIGVLLRFPLMNTCI
jgi:hypothetical protein